MKIYNPSAIRILRQAHNLSPDAFAAKIGSKSKRMIVAQWEGGQRMPSVPSLLSIVNAFQVPLEIFFVDTKHTCNNKEEEEAAHE